MRDQCIICKLLVCLSLILIVGIVHAGIPLWKITPLTSNTLTVPVNGVAIVKYRVTNQSKRTHSLTLKEIPGITQVTTAGNCPNIFVLGYQQSCILSLQINGSALESNVISGPILWEHNNPIESYQPSEKDRLKIKIGDAVYYSVGGTVTGLQ